MNRNATTVEEYLASLPEDRRAALEAVRAVVLANLRGGYTEGVAYGMIGYCVPHTLYPAGYHCDPRMPLPFASLGSQKNHMAIYLMCLYGSASEEKRFRAEWSKSGKRLDMGKSCIRFRKVEDLALDVLGEAIARVPVAKYIANYEKAMSSRRPGKGARGKPKAGAKRSGGRAGARSSRRGTDE